MGNKTASAVRVILVAYHTGIYPMYIDIMHNI
jgi:hypothetical protein